ncbi:MAG: gliding motility-associated C-terminal domain-containing protein [Salibacteraceae bacterium]
MKKALRNLSLIVCFLFTGNLSAQFWMQKGGSNGVDEAYDVVVDGSGNAYATGYFTGTATFGNTTLVSSGASDIFVVKINNNGVYQWAVKAGGSGTDRGLSIDIDGSANVFVTGFFNNTASFGNQSVTSAGQQDVFITKYSSGGVLQWVESAGGANSDIGNGISVDNGGNAVVAGEFKGTSSFGMTNIVSQNNSTDAFITKLNGSGTFQWTKAGSGNFSDRALDVATDNSGNIYATGQFSDTFAFDNIVNNTMFNAIFVVKLNSSGNEQWFRMAGGANSNIATAIDATGSGDVFITGDFAGNLTFFNTVNTNLNNTYTNGVFVTKYTSAGAISWASKSGSDSDISSQGIAVDNSGNAYITGFFECAFDEYMDEYGEAIFNSVGYKDIYVSKFTSSGTWSWARHIGGRQDEFGLGIDVTSTGNAHIAGNFKSNINIPTSQNFVTSNLSNWTDVSCNQNSPYCNDSDYGSFYRMGSAGNADALIANCFDPNREPYDYYERSGSGCNRDIAEGCINTGCPDTASNCNNVILTAIPKVCPSIGPNLTYLWSNGQTASQTFFSSSGYKWVDFKTQDGCFTYRDSIYVDILPGPDKPYIEDDVVVNTPTPFPIKINVCVPDTVTLTASQFTVDSFYWQGPSYPGFVYTASIEVWETGTYIFTIVDEEGCAKSSQVDVEFFDPLDSFDLQVYVEDSIFVCDNETFKIYLYDSIDNPTAEEICLTDSQPFIQTNYTTLPASWPTSISCQTFLNVTPMDTGWFHFSFELYRYIPCDTDTFYISDSVYVTPLPSPTVGAFSIGIGGRDYYCPGETIALWGEGGSVYTWSGPFVNGSIADTVYVGSPGSYGVSSTIYETNQYGCTDSLTANASKTVMEKPQPTLSSVNEVICPNDSVWLTVSNTGATEGFIWEGPNGIINSDSSSIAVTDAGTYFCTVNDSDSCDLASNTITLTQYNTPSLAAGGNLVICDGDSVVLNVVSSSGSSIEWLPPLSGSGTSQTVYEPGVYTCKITACGIETYATIEVFPSYVASEITPSGVLCLDSHIVLYGTDSMEIYDWSSSPSGADSIIITETGTYILTTTDANGCTKESDPVTIEITQEPTVIGLDGYPVFCYDDSITLYGNDHMSSYLWLPNGDTTQNIISFEEGVFTLKTVDTNGCRGASEPIKVTIPDTIAKFSIDGDLEFCEGDSVDFRANRRGMASYLWLPDSIEGRNISFYESGTYSLITLDTFGCDAWSDSIEVYVQPNDIEKPIGGDSLICMGTQTTLEASVNIGDLKWSRSPYGSVINEGEIFETSFLFHPTPYYVWSDFELCRGDTSTIWVMTQDCETVYDPNIFTPNGDGINDIFTLTLNEITCLDMVIFNRWGLILYEGSGLSAGWDGTNQRTGKLASEGTYYFIANFCRHNGSTGTIRGYLTLIR